MISFYTEWFYVVALFNFQYTYLTEPRLMVYYLHTGDHNYLPEEVQGTAHWYRGHLCSVHQHAHPLHFYNHQNNTAQGREDAFVTPSRWSQPQGSRNLCLMEVLVLLKAQDDCSDFWLDEEEEVIEGFKSSLVCIDV